MKKTKILLVILLVVSFIFGGYKVNAENEEVTTTGASTERTPVPVIVFHGETCPHCHEAFEWFDSIEGEYGQYFDLVKYEVWNDESNAALMNEVASYLGETPEGVPYIIIGTKTFSGFTQSYSDQIISAIMEEYNKNLEERVNVIENIQNGVELKKEKDNSTAIIFCLVVIALIAFVIFARNGQNETKIELEKKNVAEVIEDDEEVEEKTEKSKSSNSKKESKSEKATDKKTNTKKTTKSKKANRK